MRKITPFLWFNDNAEEAMTFYTSIFRNSRIGAVQRHDRKVLTGTFELEGQQFMALNGGPRFTFNESVSFFVSCETQDEVDYFWNRLREGGGTESMCGWLKDRFGLSWQVVPSALGRMLGDKDPAKAQRVMQAMLAMRKIVIADLERAYHAA